MSAASSNKNSPGFGPSRGRRMSMMDMQKLSLDDLVLTPTEIAEFKEAFEIFDVDGGGSISHEELKKVMRSVGVKVTDDEIQHMIDEVDEDGNGEIEFDEFLVMMKRKKSSSAALEDIKALYRFMDADNSGGISFEEMKIALNGVKDKLTDKETETLFDDLDVDQNGNISFDEFIHMWTK